MDSPAQQAFRTLAQLAFGVVFRIYDGLNIVLWQLGSDLLLQI